jgi:hypothetical protein
MGWITDPQPCFSSAKCHILFQKNKVEVATIFLLIISELVKLCTYYLENLNSLALASGYAIFHRETNIWYQCTAFSYSFSASLVNNINYYRYVHVR